MSEIGQVPVRESVGAALRFVRENVRFVALVALISAGVSAALSGVQLAAPQIGLFAPIVSAVAQGFIYAALVAAVLYGAGAVRARIAGDGWRVFAAMAVIGFFLFLVFFVVTIPVAIILAVGPMAAYAPDLQAAGGDEAAVMAVMTRFAEEQPWALLLTFLFYAVVWFALTSRLYLAAPASVEHKRVLTFETWAWTKGQTLRITGARLMLLAPAYVLVTALGFVVGRLTGVDVLDPATSVAVAETNPGAFLAYVFVVGFLTAAFYSALEAGLSSYLYRGLKPQDAPQPGL